MTPALFFDVNYSYDLRERITEGGLGANGKPPKIKPQAAFSLSVKPLF